MSADSPNGATESLDDVVGRAKRTINDATDRVADSLSKAADQLAANYDAIRVRTQRRLSETVDPFVEEKPYAALGLALVAGIVLGVLIFGRGPKVIYVRPPKVRG
jgi:ElaB/YqjD/DUF883 family membrane-anchored ribosome-binding protein